jgi:hypothetical protein
MASGNTLAIFFPNDAEPPLSGYATFDTRNSHPVLDFDASSAEAVMFTSFMPRYYAGGGITTTILWASTSVTTGSTVWGVELERLDINSIDTDADSFGTLNIASGTAPSSTNGALQSTSITHTSGTQMDNVVGGDFFRLKVWRMATLGQDSMTGDAELFGIEVKET